VFYSTLQQIRHYLQHTRARHHLDEGGEDDDYEEAIYDRDEDEQEAMDD